MNNQFNTQFLWEEEGTGWFEEIMKEYGADEGFIAFAKMMVEKGYITPERAIEIFKQTIGLDETSTAGGGVTGGPTAATWDPQGPTGSGEQTATTKAFKGTKKRKYQEGTFEDHEIAIYDGKEDGLTKIYKHENEYYGINDNFDFTAKDPADLAKKLREFGYTLLSGSIEEDAPRLAGSPGKTTKQGAKNLSAYSSVGFTKAPNAAEAGKHIKGVQVKQLWKEGEKETEVSWSMIEDTVKKLGKRDLGIDPESRDGQEFLAYIKDAFHQGLIKSGNELLQTIHGYKETLREDTVEEVLSQSDYKKAVEFLNKVQNTNEKLYNAILNVVSDIYPHNLEKELGPDLAAAGLMESRAYSQFKKQTATRPKDQQMHEAVKMIHKKLEEVSRLVEFAQQMRNELSEGEQTLEYKHNTKKIFEKINSKVVEVYTKTRELK